MEVTVEPVLFLFMVAIYMLYYVQSDLIYTRICEMNFDHDVCADLNNSTNKHALDLVQEKTSHWILWFNIAIGVPAVFSSAYFGSWGDKYSRKYILLLPLAGAAFAAAFYIFIAAHQTASVGFILVSASVSGIFGGNIALTMAVMSYVSDISDEGSRTMRLGILEGTTFCGATIGPILTGVMVEKVGHAYTFGLVLFIYVLAIFYTIVFVKNIKPKRDDSQKTETETSNTNSRYHLFNIRHMKESFTVCFQKRQGNSRTYIVLLLINMLLLIVIRVGENDIYYLYVKDDPLAWSYSLFSYYSAFRNGVGALFLLVGLPLMRKFHFRDTIIAILANLSLIASTLLLGFSTTTVMIFFVPVAGLISRAVFPTIRSLVSQRVEQEEQGKLFAVVETMENMGSLLASVVFNSLYPVTRLVIHGFIYYLAATILLLPLAIFIWLHKDMKPYSTTTVSVTDETKQS